MTAVANIVLNDSVPAARTFEPMRVADTLVTYADKSPGVFLEYPQISLGNRLPTAANGNYKATVRIRLPVPVDNSLDPSLPPKLAYTLSANIDIVIPSQATTVEKFDLYWFLNNLVADQAVVDLVTDADLPY